MKLVIKTVHQTLKTLSRGRQNLLLNSPPHTDTTFESHSSMSCLVFLSSNFLHMKKYDKNLNWEDRGNSSCRYYIILLCFQRIWHMETHPTMIGVQQTFVHMPSSFLSWMRGYGTPLFALSSTCSPCFTSSSVSPLWQTSSCHPLKSSPAQRAKFILPKLAAKRYTLLKLPRI